MRLERRLLVILAALPLGACSESASGSGGTGGGPPPPPPPPPPVIVSGPILVPNPNAAVPLAATVELATDVPTKVTLTLDDGSKIWSVTPQPAFALAHETPVLGVRPDRTHLITVKVTDQAGLSTVAPSPLTFVTPPLPAGFPPLLVDVSDPTRMEPGVTLLAPNSVGAHTGPTITPLVMLDAQGQVVWYFEGGLGISDARRIANGNLLFIGNDSVVEIDMFGNQVGLWWPNNIDPQGAPPNATLVPTDSFHHEVSELPPGDIADFVALSSEMRQIPNYPSSVIDPHQTQPLANVVGDVIVAFDRDGTVVKEWKLLDSLDPYRVCYESLGGFWTGYYGVTTYDWSHANSVELDPSDDSWVVSCRHQDAVIKIDRASGDLVWILGDHERWFLPWSARLLEPVRSPDQHSPGSAAPFNAFPDDRFAWNYHQHAPHVLAGGHLMLFDNGNGRAIPPKLELPMPDRYSRALELSIDRTKMTVSQVWDHGGAEDKWYSGFLCDADALSATDNVLVCDGGKLDLSTLKLSSRVFEVTRDDPGEIVFQVRVQNLDPFDPGGWICYRAERLPGVYP